MVKVNVATLKAELSHYLELIETGEQILVTSHGKEIARISSAHVVNAEPVNWIDFSQKHGFIKTKIKGMNASALVRMLRDDG